MSNIISRSPHKYPDLVHVPPYRSGETTTLSIATRLLRYMHGVLNRLLEKSQLAIEYSYQIRCSSPQTWVFWIHASSKARIEEGYRRIAEATRLSGWDDPKVDILQRVRAWLCDESNGSWVTIVDNADDSSVLSDLAGESSNGSVLVTAWSREAALELVGNDEDILKVEPMSESYGLALFRKKLNGDDKEKGADVARLLLKEARYRSIPLSLPRLEEGKGLGDDGGYQAFGVEVRTGRLQRRTFGAQNATEMDEGKLVGALYSTIKTDLATRSTPAIMSPNQHQLDFFVASITWPNSHLRVGEWEES
ncbi:MAG: hypothetical protein L6R40_007830 [Gallowayella cf. fulva]|nr:MAG: hypothetical protein L6R40_007830 [Xanthomendoza cf. fulva]